MRCTHSERIGVRLYWTFSNKIESVSVHVCTNTNRYKPKRVFFHLWSSLENKVKNWEYVRPRCQTHTVWIVHTKSNRFFFLVNFCFDLFSTAVDTVAHQRIKLSHFWKFLFKKAHRVAVWPGTWCRTPYILTFLK